MKVELPSFAALRCESEWRASVAGSVERERERFEREWLESSIQREEIQKMSGPSKSSLHLTETRPHTSVARPSLFFVSAAAQESLSHIYISVNDVLLNKKEVRECRRWLSFLILKTLSLFKV